MTVSKEMTGVGTHVLEDRRALVDVVVVELSSVVEDCCSIVDVLGLEDGTLIAPLMPDGLI